MKYKRIWEFLKGQEGITGPPEKQNETGMPDRNTRREQDAKEFQICAEDDSLRRRAQRDFELAIERLAESRAELEKVRAEYQAMPDRIRLLEWQFNQALKTFAEVKRAGEKDCDHPKGRHKSLVADVSSTL